MAADPIQNAVEYIEKNITEPISLVDVAAAAGFSVPHLYRLFRALTGMPIGAYVQAKRLALAAEQLRGSRRVIAQISFELGFASQDTFSRAFARAYGTTPGRFRRGGGAPIPTPALQDTAAAGEVRCRIVEAGPFAVIGMECAAKQWDADGAIGRLWSDTLTRLERMLRGAPATMYGICEWEPECNGQFTYMAATDALHGTVPKGFIRRAIPKGLFVEADVPAHVSVPEGYGCAAAFAQSNGYPPDERDSLEVYSEIFRDPATHSFQLLLPVRR